jgi:hypothetical protein
VEGWPNRALQMDRCWHAESYRWWAAEGDVTVLLDSFFFCEKCFWIPVVGELGTQRIFWILGKILCYYRASRSSVRSFHLPRKAMQHLCSEGKLRGGEEESGVSQAVFLDDVYMLKDGVHDCILNLPDLSFDFGKNKLAEHKWTQS